MTKSIDCIECGVSVAYGRLSCPTCGALLASVGGRPSVAAASVDRAEAIPEPHLLPEDDEAGTVSIWPSVSDRVDDGPPATLTGRPYRPSTAGELAGPAATGIPGAYRLSSLTLANATGATGSAARPRVADHRPSTRPIDPARLADI